MGGERPAEPSPRALAPTITRRNDVALERGAFRVRGDTIEVFPAYDEQGVRSELWGDQVERVTKIHPTTGNVITTLERCAIYPATHYVVRRPTLEAAVKLIRAELAERLADLRAAGKLLEAQRLEQPLEKVRPLWLKH